jgi:hypothetical protein
VCVYACRIGLPKSGCRARDCEPPPPPGEELEACLEAPFPPPFWLSHAPGRSNSVGKEGGGRSKNPPMPLWTQSAGDNPKSQPRWVNPPINIGVVTSHSPNFAETRATLASEMYEVARTHQSEYEKSPIAAPHACRNLRMPAHDFKIKFIIFWISKLSKSYVTNLSKSYIKAKKKYVGDHNGFPEVALRNLLHLTQRAVDFPGRGGNRPNFSDKGRRGGRYGPHLPEATVCCV